MNWNSYGFSNMFYGQPSGCSFTLLLILIPILYFCSCKQIEYVPIESTHTIEHHHTDSVREIDSIFKNKETIIMQLDSEAMAQYGIRLQAAERAWLVRTAELERLLSKQQHTKTDTLIKRDSIPIPYPVVKIETKHHWGGWVAFGGLLLSLVITLLIRYKTRK